MWICLNGHSEIEQFVGLKMVIQGGYVYETGQIKTFVSLCLLYFSVIARELRRSVPNGIPLVFIHGNAGNPGQARSIGSILQMKAETRNRLGLPIYSVYTIDFNQVRLIVSLQKIR